MSALLDPMLDIAGAVASASASAGPAAAAAAQAAEAHRRGMLAESDELLERLEQLRLDDQVGCPPLLGEAVRRFLIRLGRVPPHRPRTLRAAQSMVFSA